MSHAYFIYFCIHPGIKVECGSNLRNYRKQWREGAAHLQEKEQMMHTSQNMLWIRIKSLSFLIPRDSLLDKDAPEDKGILWVLNRSVSIFIEHCICLEG